MHEYEHAVLSVLSTESTSVGWYKIEQRLSQLSLSERQYLPDVLKKLLEMRLIEDQATSGGRYSLTALGAEALRAATLNQGNGGRN
jgi:DNA-binding PadR family transcriptional regulator